MEDTDFEHPPKFWKFGLLWAGVSTISILGGMLLGAFLNDALWNFDLPPDAVRLVNNPIQRAIVFGLSIGGIKSLLEKLVLQRWKIKWDGWILTSLLGWTIGVTVAAGVTFNYSEYDKFKQLLGGMIIGFSQWIILRNYLPQAFWWIIANGIGSLLILGNIPLGYTFLIMLEGFIAFIIAGLFFGIITAVPLTLLLHLSWLEKIRRSG